MLIIVSKNAGEGFSSLQEALDSIPPGELQAVTIRIKPGIYEEKVTIAREAPPILLLGEDQHSTIISWNDNAHTLGADGEPLRTFRTGTLNVFAEGFTAENLTIRNTSGPGTGQAVAAFVDAGQAVFRRVRLLGDQDTLYTGPGRQYYDDCYIEGMWIIFLVRLPRCLTAAISITSAREGISQRLQRRREPPSVMCSWIAGLPAAKG